MGAPYKTSALSFDMGLFKKKWEKSYLGAGLFVFNDKAGDTQLGTTQVNLALSSIVNINEKQKLSAGLLGGFSQRSINMTNAQWGSQYNGSSFDPSLPTNELPPNNSFYYGDISAGVAWHFYTTESNLSSKDGLSINLGAALYHVNTPKYKFSNQSASEDLQPRLVLHGASLLGINNTNWGFTPSFIYMKQGTLQEINVGTFVRYILQEESKFTGIFKETALSLGGYWRAKDAFIPTIMLEYASFAVGVSYDVNISSLKAATNKRGGIEISLRFINPNPFKSGTGTVRFL
jgi:type IX secretion system PorP/SprF family membrane protein